MIAAAPDLAAFRAARSRIAGRVRRTPMLEAAAMRAPPAGEARLLLKLECLQPTGSFKVRGAANALACLGAGERRRGLVTASSGNHGQAVAWAAWSAGVPAAVHVPDGTAAAKVAAIRAWGAEVAVGGAVWDDANRAALARAAGDGRTHIHPFADPRVIEGQGTLGLEILEQAPALDTLIVAIGGGGLIAGVATAVKALRPGVRVIGVEPVGAPTLHDSRAAGGLVELERITTRAGSLAPRRSEMLNHALITAHVDEILLVDDAAMAAAARLLWEEFAIATELAGAASVAALASGAVRPAAGETVCAIVCGAGTDGITGSGGEPGREREG